MLEVKNAKKVSNVVEDVSEVNKSARSVDDFMGAARGRMNETRARYGFNEASDQINLMSSGASGKSSKILLDNNIVSWLFENNPKAVAFAEKYKGLLTIEDTVVAEALKGGRTAEQLDDLMSLHSIDLLEAVSDSYATTVMTKMERTVLKNDVRIIAAAEKYGLRLTSSDYKVVTGAVKAGVDVRAFRFTDDAANWYADISERFVQNKLDPNVYIGPLNPW